MCIRDRGIALVTQVARRALAQVVLQRHAQNLVLIAAEVKPLVREAREPGGSECPPGFRSVVSDADELVRQRLRGDHADHLLDERALRLGAPLERVEVDLPERRMRAGQPRRR